MAGFIEGAQRSQTVLFPDRLEDWIDEDDIVRVVDLFVDELDLADLGYVRSTSARTGRPGYHPAVLLKLFIYGYLNRIPSSRRLEREAGRNVEVMWLIGRLVPDHKTIAEFCRTNGGAIRKTCAQFVDLCRRIGVLKGETVAIDGSKFKAVNNRDRNFTKSKIASRLAHLEADVERYIDEMVRIDRQEEGEAHTRKVRNLARHYGRIRQEIGRHAIDFGYVSTSLFDEPNESVALNFFIRALSPAVFIILVSSGAVAAGRPDLRLGIINVVPYYYVLRALVVLLLNRHRLISWPRYVAHAVAGTAIAVLAYEYLILPNRSLIPDLKTAGNELWLALLAFLYAIANKVTLSSGPGGRRRNAFVNVHYAAARAQFGKQIDAKVSNELLKLITYSILIYEDYCRPPFIRSLERYAVWKKGGRQALCRWLPMMPSPILRA